MDENERDDALDVAREYTIPDLLKDDRARTMWVSLCREYQRVHGAGIPDSSLALICDVCMMEQTKLLLLPQIANRPIEHVRNGRQEYYKPNSAIAEVNRLATTQRRHLAELKLTPASSKSTANTADDDDDFGKF